MKLLTLRAASAQSPQANSTQETWVLLQDNEKVLDVDSFDGRVTLLIGSTVSDSSVSSELFVAGDLDHELLPNWIKRDDNGIIAKLDGEQQMQAFVRQWRDHSIAEVTP